MAADCEKLNERAVLADTSLDFKRCLYDDDVSVSMISDFRIGDYTFEVGGKNKGRKQLEDVPNGIVVKDDIEFGSYNIIPL